MTKRKSRDLNADTFGIDDATEARIQAGIAADPDNPEWTDADFAHARPAAEALPAELYAALARTRGRPKADVTKVPVKLRLDPEVIELFKVQGPGWQTRMNSFLAAHDVVLQMIDDHEDIARSVRRVLGQIEKGEIKPIAPSLGKSVAGARRSLDASETTIASLRTLLQNQAVKRVARAAADEPKERQ